MIFDWLRKKPELAVEVLGEDIVVSLPGTSCHVVYTKGRDNKLVASTFSAFKVPDINRRITFAKFLALAWTAANEKAKDMGWIA
ncbi:MAG: hypothetical protein WAU90_05835 [Methyloceanibacter sp.]